MSERIKVIFRKFPDGEVIALFPESPSSCTNPYEFDCYVRVGGHGAANHTVVNITKRAKPSEYADMKMMLERIYGYDLEIRKRITPQMDAARKAALGKLAKED